MTLAASNRDSPIEDSHPVNMNTIPQLRFLLLFAFSAINVSAMPNRGLWFWGSTTIPDGTGGTTSSPYGSDLVVGNNILERDCLEFFKLHHVKRVYGSYGNRPVSEQATIGSWNEKLDCLRIDSQVLIAGSLVSPADHSYYLSRVSSRLIDFNNDFAAQPARQFDALHLDIEPQQQNAWKIGSASVRRAFLQDLLDTYTAIRNHLDSNGYPDIPIYADIPFSWDKFPGSIGWADATDRDNWFLDLEDVLDGLSIMTFSKDTAPELDTATAYERSGALDGFSRIGIQPKVGVVDPPEIIWPDYPTFNGVLNDLETLVEPNETTDIENLGFWRHAIDSTGLGYTLRNRGLWFWEQNSFEDDTVSIYDGLSVVGQPVRENEALEFMTNRQVHHLYGEYTNRPVDQPLVIAAWNAKLHSACINSESIFRGNETYLPDFKTDLLDEIQDSFLDFMDAMGSDEPSKFKALRLRISPQYDFSWDVWTPSYRRDQLDSILDILGDTRALLDTAGYPHIPLNTDIAANWDQLPIDGGDIGWGNAADRDSWFENLHQIVDSVSLLSFQETTPTSIDAITSNERATTLPTKARVGMKPDICLSGIWSSLTAFQSAMASVEDNIGPAESVDIDSYARWRHFVEKGSPVINTGNGLTPPSTLPNQPDR
ncbi:hypothetical protein N9195_01465 [bacterium]|nr:hypothetical protein [bacterium]